MILTTTIGSFPKPSFLPLSDWFKGEKGTDNERPTSEYQEEKHKMGSQYESLVNEASKQVIDDQITCGIDIVTDGEVRRENYIYYQCRQIEGIDFKTVTHKSVRAGAFEADLPTIIKPVSLRAPILGRDYKTAQQFTNKPVKITIPGPMTITDSIADEFYNDDKKLGADLGNALNQEILSLVEAGCQYIQVDEPVFARKPEKALEYGVENLERCFAGVPDHVTRAMHACCGYPNALDTDNYYKAPPQSYFDIAEAIDQSSINAISIEDAHRPNDPKLLELFKNTTVMMGLVDVAKSKLEEVDQVKQRIKLCLEHIDRERFIAAPDCGLGLLNRDLAKEKLKNLCQAAHSI